MSKFYTSCIQWGSKILYKGIENGKPITIKDDFKPTLYKASKKDTTEWSSLYGQPLDAKLFEDINEAKKYIDSYKDVSGFDIHGMTQFQYQYINENFPDEVQYDVDQMHIEFMDIEVISDAGFPDIETAPAPIVLISMHNKATNQTIVFGTKPYTKSNDFEFRLFKDENSLLRSFVTYWADYYPDIVGGWNTDQFDFPYTINRINKILGEDWVKKLSPFGIVREKMIEVRGKEIQTYDIFGVTQLDYLELYKKFGTYSAKESYALAFIAQEEIGETKKEAPCESFKEWYEDYYDSFVEYNAHDSRLVHRIDNKMKLIDLAISVAYLAKINFKEVFSPVRTWDVLIYNHLSKKKIAIPPHTKKLASAFEGAYVKEPKLKLYGWGMSFDFASLYPTIIRQWNLSPETLVKEQREPITVDVMVQCEQGLSRYAQENDLTVAANGSLYRKDKKGIIPEMMEMMMVGRKVAKKEMLKLEQQYQETHDDSLVPKISALNNRQMALKILANAGYGAITNAGFRYFELAIGEAITLTGQASNKHVEKNLNLYMNKVMKTTDVDYVTYMDTDSAYLNVDDLVQKICPNKSIDATVKFLDKIGSEIQKAPIQNSVNHIFDLCNCFEKLMDMKREAIYSRGLWTAKKRYALKVHNSEGVEYKPYKLKVMGLEIVKSSTPQVVRKKLKEVVGVIFEKDEIALQDFVANYRKEFSLYSPEEIGFPRGVTDIDKWAAKDHGYKKGTPMHVRAAILYNKHYGEDHQQEIANGDKIKFIYMKLPNPIKEDVFGFPSAGKFPEIDRLLKFVDSSDKAVISLTKYIDTDKMFYMTFIRPLESIVNAIGWSIEKQSTLEDFFG